MGFTNKSNGSEVISQVTVSYIVHSQVCQILNWEFEEINITVAFVLEKHLKTTKQLRETEFRWRFCKTRNFSSQNTETAWTVLPIHLSGWASLCRHVAFSKYFNTVYKMMPTRTRESSRRPLSVLVFFLLFLSLFFFNSSSISPSN